LQDFLNVLKRRSLWLDVLVVPAIVQGEASASSLIDALIKVQNIEGIDVIVLTRGGGAIEDLWSFNDEKLVRSIAACTIPVISAVGHHVDYTLCDYVADFRAETPTAAAEILSQSHTELKQRMNLVGHKIKHHLYDFHTQLERKVKKLNPLNLLYLLNKKFHQFQLRLNQVNPAKRVHELMPLNEYQRQTDDLLVQMETLIHKRMQIYQHRIGLNHSMLRSLNPNNVLGRGYSLLWSDNSIVTDAKTFRTLASHDKLQLQFHDGKVSVKKD
jgi:exodeoxyribonuclease VII large subunit